MEGLLADRPETRTNPSRTALCAWLRVATRPRRTSSAQWADTWLGLDVGTDIALSNTIAREIIHAGLANERFIERSTTGFDDYRQSVEPCTLEECERAAGILREAARRILD